VKENKKKEIWRRWIQPRRLLSVGLKESCARVVLVPRNGNGTESYKAFSVKFPIPWTEDPEAAGHRLAERLQQERWKAKKALVLLDPAWVFLGSASLPPIEKEEIPAYADLQAEKIFPLPRNDLAVAFRVTEIGKETQRLVLAAVPQRRVQAVQRLLQAAGLELVSLTTDWGVNIQDGHTKELHFRIRRAAKRLELLVVAGKTPLAYQSAVLSGSEGASGQEVQGAEIVRQVRMLVGRLDPEVREKIRTVTFEGPPEQWNGVIDSSRQHLERFGLEVAVEDSSKATEKAFEDRLDPILVRYAKEWLENQSVPFEFLPPRISTWERLLQRSAKGPGRLAAEIGAGVVALFVVAMIAHIQYYKHLEKRWQAMKPAVSQLQEIQSKIQKFRSWFAEEPVTLSVANHIAEAFPVEGRIWARILQIKSDGTVRISGRARDNQSLLQLLEKFRKDPQILEVKLQQSRGKDPIEFVIQLTVKHGH